MILALFALASAHEVELALDDVAGVVTEPMSVELVGPGGRAAFTPTDDGAAPDVAAGDHRFTAHGTVRADNGQIVVRAGARTWQGGFSIVAAPDGSRVALVVRLEADGLAAVSRGGGAPAMSPGVPMGGPPVGGAPGGSPPGVAGVPGGTGAPGGLPPLAGPSGTGTARMPTGAVPAEAARGLPDGMWLGWVLAAGALALLGALAWLGGRAGAGSAER